jgi:hypothetical protein
MPLSDTVLRLSAGGCLGLLVACVVVPVPVGTTSQRTVAPAQPTSQQTLVRQAPVTSTAQTVCAPDEIRVASGGCRKRDLYRSGDDSGGSGGGGGGGGSDNGGGWN